MKSLCDYKPRQGNFKSKDSYAQWPAPKELADTVVCFWQLCVSKDETRFLSIPDACVRLGFDTNNGRYAFLIGPYTTFIEYHFSEAHNFFGIRFRPGVVQRFIDVDLPAIKNKAILIDGLQNKVFGKLVSKINMQETSTQRQTTIEKWLNKNQMDRRLDRRTLNALNLIIESHGSVKLNNNFATQVGLSLRQIRRNTNLLTGLSIKEFSRVIRFQFALQAMHDGKSAQFHNNYGFFDHSHLIREFKCFTEHTPARFLNLSVLSN